MTVKAAAKTAPELWTIKHAAEFCKVHSATIYNRIRDGSYRAYRVGQKMMVDAESVRAFQNPKPILVKPNRRRARDVASSLAA